MHGELLTLQRTPQILFYRLPLHRPRIHGGFEELIALPAIFLRLVHRRIRILDQSLRILAVIRIHAHPDAGRDVQIVLVDQMRYSHRAQYSSRHDDGILRLRKIREDYNPSDRIGAVKTLMEAHESGEVLTGVFYVDTEKPTFTDLLNLVDQPLSSLPESVTRPSKAVLDKVMASLQ